MLYSSQSATSEYLHCPRAYWYNYRYLGTGITPMSASIPLTTGGCVHLGVQTIAEQYLADPTIVDIDKAVAVALQEYTRIVEKHPLSISTSGKLPSQQLYTFREQLALTEALIRLWYLKEWPKIIEYYDILAVEQEIQFELVPGVMYQSKPDLILLHKKNNDVINYSLKTVRSANERLEKSYKVQLQTVTEPYATSIWLAQFKRHLGEAIVHLASIPVENGQSSKYLKGMIAYSEKLIRRLPDVSSATRFCYLVKGDRREEIRGSGDWKTDNPLIYGYRQFTPMEIRYAAFGRIAKPENKSGWGLLGRGWEQFSTWDSEEVGGVKGWMKILKGEEYTDWDGMHVFNRQILSEPDVNANPRIIEDRMRQLKIIESTIQCNMSTCEQDEQVLDYFPMDTQACYFPLPCPYLTICPNGNDSYKQHVADDPLSSEWSMYEMREPHHEPERLYFKNQFVQSIQRADKVNGEAGEEVIEESTTLKQAEKELLDEV